MTQHPPKKTGLRTPMMTRTAAAARRTQAQSNRYGQQGNNASHQSHNRAPNKSRINPRDAFEKYSNLAKDALLQQDKILAENYYQHADHYYRLILESRPAENQNSGQERHAAPMQQKAVRPAVKMPVGELNPSYSAPHSGLLNTYPTFEKADTIHTPPLFLQQEIPEKAYPALTPEEHRGSDLEHSE